MKQLHYWLLLVLITVLLFGGTPKLASIEILEHDTYLDWNMAKLTNESAGIIWFRNKRASSGLPKLLESDAKNSVWMFDSPSVCVPM